MVRGKTQGTVLCILPRCRWFGWLLFERLLNTVIASLFLRRSTNVELVM